MVGNIILNTRQIYIYQYLKCQFFTSLFARNDYHITAKPRKTRKKYFDYLAAKNHTKHAKDPSSSEVSQTNIYGKKLINS